MTTSLREWDRHYPIRYVSASVVWTRWLFGVMWTPKPDGHHCLFVYVGPLAVSVSAEPRRRSL